MASVEPLLRAFENQLDLGWHSTRAGPQRVWMCVYDPALERKLLLRLDEFRNAVVKRGKSWRPLDLAASFSTWLARSRFRERYFADPTLLAPGAPALEEFAEALRDRLLEELRQPDADERSVVALHGVGALFKLASTAALLKSVDGEIRGRVLVFFPGRLEADRYRLFDAYDSWDYLAVPVLPAPPGGA